MVIIKWVSVCLQGNEISGPLFCFAVMADSSGIVCVACLMSCSCVAPLFDWTWFSTPHASGRAHAGWAQPGLFFMAVEWRLLFLWNCTYSLVPAFVWWSFLWQRSCEVSWGPAAARVCSSQEKEERWWLEYANVLTSLEMRDVCGLAEWTVSVSMTQLAKPWSCVGGETKCNLFGWECYRTCL